MRQRGPAAAQQCVDDRAAPGIVMIPVADAKATWNLFVAWQRGNTAAPLRTLLDEELATREFVPQVRRLVGVSSFTTPSTWHVETDRGDTTFVLKGEEDIRRLGSRSRLMIASEEGIHFLVPDVAALDKASRKLLERFL